MISTLKKRIIEKMITLFAFIAGPIGMLILAAVIGWPRKGRNLSDYNHDWY